MKPHSADDETPRAHARSLLADIHGAPNTTLPRRDALVIWLDAFLLRAGQRGYATEPAEIADLAALEKFLRAHAIPITATAA